MNTKIIFKALAVAMLLPAMLLTTACSNSDDAINENPSKKGYELPVTVNVTRQGDEGTTRSTYTDNGNGTGTLGFETGDQLYVEGSESSAGLFSGTLTWQSGGTFSGTITTDNVYSGTADELFTAAASNGYVQATLLPNGYGTYNFFGFSKGSLVWEYNNAFATSKATAIEQFSYEFANTYSSGFALSPQSAILNFTITGLAASTEVAVSLTDGYVNNVSGNVTTDGSGTAEFAIGVGEYTSLNSLSLTVGGNAVTLVSSSMSAVAGKVYNIARSAAPGSNTIDLSTVTVATTAQNGDVLTGTLANNVQISIADGATVILNNVNINGSGTWTSSDYAGLTCLGDATIILSGTNTVRGFTGYYPGLQAGPAGKTLTIKGTGSLTARGANVKYPGASGIGAAYYVECGNIVIESGNITATGGYAGIGGANGSAGLGSGTCGDITITGGTVTATALSYGAGIGAGRGEYGSCGNITISGGTVTAIATAKNALAAAIGAGSLSSTCTSVTIGTGITSLTMTNGYSSATGIVSNFINATAVNANTTPITYMLPTSVTDPTIIGGMAYFGFATSYNEGTKTWTVTK